jgi:hypothetical protein
MEDDRQHLNDTLRRHLTDLAERAIKLVDSLDDAHEVRWVSDHSQGFSYDAARIERDLAKLVLLNQILPKAGA